MVCYWRKSNESDICSIGYNIGAAIDACSRSFTWSLLKKRSKSLHRNMFKKVCCFCSMSRTNQQASFYNDEFNAYAFRHNAFGYISVISTQCISFGNMYSNGNYRYAFSNAGLYGCTHYLQTST